MSRPTATLQTPPGRGGIAVIALRGPGCQEVLEQVFRPFRSHAAGGQDVLRLGHLVDGCEVIDEAIVCLHGAGCEINIHGGPAVARRTMEMLVAAGAVASPAEPAAADTFPLAHPQWANPAIGAELLGALPAAKSELAVSALTHQWSAGLSELVAGALAEGATPSQSLSQRLRQAAGRLTVMQRLLAPAEVVIAGPPNVGKSTLANALVGRQVSIVDSSAGTTRDWVRELAVLDGLPVWLTDTAGLWEPADGVDAEAVRRARQRAEQADIVLLLSAGEPTAAPPWLHARNVVGIWAKVDLSSPPACFLGPAVSASSGEGLDQLKRAVKAALGVAAIDPASAMAFTPRQADLLGGAAEAIEAGDGPAACLCLKELLGAAD